MTARLLVWVSRYARQVRAHREQAAGRQALGSSAAHTFDQNALYLVARSNEGNGQPGRGVSGITR